MKKLLKVTLLAVALLCLMTSAALAKEAQDVTGRCVIRLSVNRHQKEDLLAGSLRKYWDGGTEGVMTVTLPGSQTAQGVMLAFYESVVPVLVEGLDGETPSVLARSTDDYQNMYIPFAQPAHSFRISAANSKTLKINRINVMTEGDLPDWVQRWEPSLREADIQLIACHPDDEVLWFGGLLPTYAGELGRRVQVTCVNTVQPERRNELLDALWLCGVTHYPHMPKGNWSSNVADYIVRTIRQTRPQVIVTQDVNGEYGSENHQIMTAAVIEAVTSLCADATAMPKSAEKYGVWQPQKLYIHLWKENESVFDWSKKLPKMGGQTGFQIARNAFRKHMSQQKGKYEVLMEGAYDCRRFGLYFTLVGPDDTDSPDLLQNLSNITR